MAQRRPSFQFYPYDWFSNSNLKRCTHAEKGVWIDLMCLLHDGEPYGLLRWSLAELSRATSASLADLQALVFKGVLKGADTGETCQPFVYTPYSGRKHGAPVILVAAQLGPIWFSSRMLADEHKRLIREENLINTPNWKKAIPSPLHSNGVSNGVSPLLSNGISKGPHLSEDEDEDEDEDEERCLPIERKKQNRTPRKGKS